MWQNIRYNAILEPTIPSAYFPAVLDGKPPFGWWIVVGEQVIDLDISTLVGDGYT
jgi:hypothetical protein